MPKTGGARARDAEQASLLPNPDPPVLKPENDRIDPTSGDCHDLFFAILFILQLVAVITAATLTIPDWLRHAQSKSNKKEESPLDSLTPLAIATTAAVALSTALFFAALCLHVLRQYARQIVQICLSITVSAYAVAGVLAMALGQIVLGVVLLAVAAMTAIFFLVVRSRVNLAATTLQISTTIVKTHQGPIVWGFFASAIICLWTLLWAVTAMSLVYAVEKRHIYGMRVVPPSLVFLYLVSFFWTTEVIFNITHVTTAGVVASWWFNGSSSNPTMSSLGRAVTTSFGSICFGSLIVAILSALRALLTIGSGKNDQDRSCVQDILGCILGVIEGMVKLFNVYVFSTIAINGTSFITASKQTMELFSKSGIDVIINDDLSSMVLMIGALPGLLITMCLSALTLLIFSVPTDVLIPASLLCGVLGLLVVMTVVSVLRSCVATIFVCWAQDPAALYRSHTNQYIQLRTAMENIRPEPLTL